MARTVELVLHSSASTQPISFRVSVAEDWFNEQLAARDGATGPDDFERPVTLKFDGGHIFWWWRVFRPRSFALNIFGHDIQMSPGALVIKQLLGTRLELNPGITISAAVVVRIESQEGDT